MYIIFSSLVDAEAYLESCNRARLLPSPGRNIGGGRHVRIEDSPGLGWTNSFSRIIKHPKRNQWASVSLDPEKVRQGRVSQEDVSRIISLRNTKQDLSSDWFNSV